MEEGDDEPGGLYLPSGLPTPQTGYATSPIPLSTSLRIEIPTRGVHGPGDEVPFHALLRNSGLFDVRMSHLNWEASLYHLGPGPLTGTEAEVLALLQAIQSGQEDPLDLATRSPALTITPMYHRILFAELEGDWIVPAGASCAFPLIDAGWNQTIGGSQAAPQGLYLYTMILDETDGQFPIGGVTLFSLAQAGAPTVAVQGTSDNGCLYRVAPEEAPGALMAGSTAQGFRFKRTSGPEHRWAAGTLPAQWRYNAAGVPTSTHMTAAAALTAIQTAQNTWEASNSRFDLTYNSAATTNVPFTWDNMNVVGWRDLGPSARAGAICYDANGDTALPAPVRECDLAFNTAMPWSAPNAVSGRLDLQDVATHEFGHWLVLDDLDAGCLYNSPIQTMCQGTSAGTTTRRDLAWGDIAGARYLYPMKHVAVDGSATGTRTGVGSVTGGGDAAAGMINSATGQPDLVVGWIQGGGTNENNIIHYRIGWDLSATTAQATSWSNIMTAVGPTATGDRTGVGTSSDGLGLAVANVDGDAAPDLVVVWVDNPDGANSIFYRIGWDLSTAGVPSAWSPIKKAGSSLSVGSKTGDVGVCVHDVDNASPAQRELIIAWVDDADGANRIYYVVGKSMSTTTGVPASWSARQAMPDGWVGHVTDGFALSCMSLNGGGLDYVFSWIDDPDKENKIVYRVGENVGTTGIVAANSWYKAPTTSSASTMSGPGFTIESIGHQSQGLGAAVANLNGVEADELIFVWVDDPSGDNKIYYWTEWDGQYRHHD